VEDVLVRAVEVPVRDERFVVAERPADARSIAIDFTQWTTFWSTNRCPTSRATSHGSHGSFGRPPTFRKNDPFRARTPSTAPATDPIQARYCARGRESE
jgi:hypothetical protein